MVFFYYISLVTCYYLLIDYTFFIFFSPCHSFISVHYLIDFLSRTKAFLVTMPRSPAGSSSSPRRSCVFTVHIDIAGFWPIRFRLPKYIRFAKADGCALRKIRGRPGMRTLATSELILTKQVLTPKTTVPWLFNIFVTKTPD